MVALQRLLEPYGICEVCFAIYFHLQVHALTCEFLSYYYNCSDKVQRPKLDLVLWYVILRLLLVVLITRISLPSIATFKLCIVLMLIMKLSMTGCKNWTCGIGSWIGSGLQVSSRILLSFIRLNRCWVHPWNNRNFWR